MPRGDIKLGEDGPQMNWVTVEGDVLKATGSDLMVDNDARRGGHTGGYRRALVHDFEDGLTVNFANDYKGGLTLNDARVNLRLVIQGPDLELPKNGTPGELLFVQSLPSDPDGPPDTTGVGIATCSLWLCVPHDVGVEPGAWWQRIPLDDPVQGTA